MQKFKYPKFQGKIEKMEEREYSKKKGKFILRKDMTLHTEKAYQLPNRIHEKKTPKPSSSHILMKFQSIGGKEKTQGGKNRSHTKNVNQINSRLFLNYTGC